MGSLYGQPGRLHCIAPGCRRTAPADRYPESTEIICGKCWRGRVAPRHRHLVKLCDAKIRREKRKRAPNPEVIDRFERLRYGVWQAIEEDLRNPTRPEGLDKFLQETGL